MPLYSFDENIREVPKDLSELRKYIQELKSGLPYLEDPVELVTALGELGANLRILGELHAAETCLVEALEVIEIEKLPMMYQVQNRLRLAHVYQWQKNFRMSNLLFASTLETCRAHAELSSYLDFALLHSGKNLFDQQKYGDALIYFEEALLIRRERKANLEQIASSEWAIQRTKDLLGTSV